jgi:hypothetical protein
MRCRTAAAAAFVTVVCCPGGAMVEPPLDGDIDCVERRSRRHDGREFSAEGAETSVQTGIAASRRGS